MKAVILAVMVLVVSQALATNDTIPEFRKGKKILLYSPIGSSHQKINIGIARSLGRLGYNVTMVLIGNDKQHLGPLLEEAGVTVVVQPEMNRERSTKHREIQADMNTKQSYFKLWNAAMN